MICSSCKKKVFPEQHHLIVEEFKNKKPAGRNYYHIQCFKEKFLVQEKMIKTLGNMNNFFRIFKEKMGVPMEESNEI